jgi:phosphate transport system protein
MSDRHLSTQFDAELSGISTRVLEMGGMVESQVARAVHALVTFSSDVASEVLVTEARVNQTEIEIDLDLSTIIARRQPTARDLRLLIAISKTIANLERVGDEAARIARTVQRLVNSGVSTRLRLPVNDLAYEAELAVSQLRKALDAFARLDVDRAVEVLKRDDLIDQEFEGLLRKLITFMMEDARTISSSIDLIFVAKAIERVGDHAKNLAEQIIYIVKGTDVRRQIVTLTYPHIGSYGTSAKTSNRRASSPPAWSSRTCRRASRTSAAALARRVPAARDTVGIAGIDTRRLTRLLRSGGAQNGCIVALAQGQAVTPAVVDDAIAQARATPSMSGLDLAKVVSVREPYEWKETTWALGRGTARSRSRASTSSPTTSASSSTSCACSRRAAADHRRAGADVGRRRAGAQPDGVFLANGPGRSRAVRLRHRGDARVHRARRADLRHLPRPPDHGARRRRAHLQDEVRPPRRQPPGQGPRQRPGQHHQPEPRLRGRPEVAAGDAAADPCVALRRHAAGPGARRQAGVLLPGPPGGFARAARHRLPVRPLRRVDGRRCAGDEAADRAGRGERACLSAPTSARS